MNISFLLRRHIEKNKKLRKHKIEEIRLILTIHFSINTVSAIRSIIVDTSSCQFSFGKKTGSHSI